MGVEGARMEGVEMERAKMEGARVEGMEVERIERVEKKRGWKEEWKGERKRRVPACLACGCEMGAVSPISDIQPDGGVLCSTRGNYGSAAFDRGEHGERLLFTVCDPCLVKAGHEGRVLVTRDFRVLLAPVGPKGLPLVVGRENLRDEPLRTWKPGEASEVGTPESRLLRMEELDTVSEDEACVLDVSAEDIRMMSRSTWRWDDE